MRNTGANMEGKEQRHNLQMISDIPNRKLNRVETVSQNILE